MKKNEVGMSASYLPNLMKQDALYVNEKLIEIGIVALRYIRKKEVCDLFQETVAVVHDEFSHQALAGSELATVLTLANLLQNSTVYQQLDASKLAILAYFGSLYDAEGQCEELVIFNSSSLLDAINKKKRTFDDASLLLTMVDEKTETLDVNVLDDEELKQFQQDITYYIERTSLDDMVKISFPAMKLK